MRSSHMRRTWLWVTLGLGALAATWGGFNWAETRRRYRELNQANREMAAGLHHLARQRLADISNSRPSWGEAAYQLGVCEEALGHPTVAIEAWSRVPSDSP